MKDDDITGTIIGCAYKVHNALGTGFLEKVYENALRIELASFFSIDLINQCTGKIAFNRGALGLYSRNLCLT